MYFYICVCVHACQVIQSCPALCDPMDCSPPGSSVHEILQARILEWVAMPSSRRPSHSGIYPVSMSPALVGKFFTTRATWQVHMCVCCAVLDGSGVQLFATPWTVAHQAPLSMGLLQVKILEWVAMPSSRRSSQPRDQTQFSRIAGGFFTVKATREV